MTDVDLNTAGVEVLLSEASAVMKASSGGGEGGFSLGALIGPIVSAVSRKVNGILHSFAASIAKAINDVMNNVSEVVEEIIDTIKSVIRSAVSSITKFVYGLVESFKGFVEGAIDEVHDLVIDVTRSISDFIDDTLDWVYDLIQDIRDGILNLIDKGVSLIEDMFGYVAEKIGDIYNSVVISLEEIQTEAIGIITGLYEKSVEYVEELYNDIKEGITSMIDGAIYIVESSLELISEASQEIVDSISALMKVVDEQIGPALAVMVEYAGMPFGIGDTGPSLLATEKSARTMSKMFDSIARAQSPDLSATKLNEKYGLGEGVLHTLLSTVIYTISTGLMLVSTTQLSNAARGDEFVQEIFYNNPVKNYSVSDAVHLHTRGFMSEDDALEYTQREGYSNEKIKNIIQGSYSPIDIERAVQAYFRETISKTELKEVCIRHGLRNDDINMLMGVINIIPPINDLISMSVRDVFSPEIVSKFDLFSDLPEEFVKWAGKQGLSEQWAEKYWGAHWRLPSANQGFSMFHRGVIDEETLKLLLRALDVSPFWREKLRDIAYQPITRVDVRRIYKMGLFDREEVVRRHRAIGYSPDDAEIMADFVESYVDVDDPDDDIDFKTLSMSQIRRLHKLGTIGDTEASDRLEGVGYSRDIAVTLVESWGDEEALKFRESLINRYVRKAIRDDLDYIQVDQLFSDLNLTIDERNKVDRIIEVERDEFDNIPTKSELKNMFKKGIISEEIWSDNMRKHGYSWEWIETYKQLYGLGNYGNN